MSGIKASELTLNSEGKIYHLNLGPDDIADDIILVGDQDRVKYVGSFFDSIRFETQNREFCTLTGTYNGKELSVISTGIGTDNVDIVLNEVDAIANINLETRTVKEDHRKLKFVRIGTCGALHEDISPGTRVLSRYVIGLDGVANFYEIPFSENEANAQRSFIESTGWKSPLNIPYIKACSEELRNKINDGMLEGITTTANGFYGPQGRAVRIPLSISDFKDKLRHFNWDGFRATNLEMECSALYALSDALGHEAVTVCLVLANRYSGEFMPEYKKPMGELIQDVLDRLTK
ncbi:MAG: nucleoside phosphorylase [Crocinitomicaceae bacterium]|nr:nucleoside phosphorylase [Crocinitomicaceae bacterium]